jgi:hypothetical protein
MKTRLLAISMILALLVVGFASAFTAFGSTDTPLSGTVINGTRQGDSNLMFNCTATFNTSETSLDNISLFGDFNGTWMRLNTTASPANATSTAISYNLPIVQAGYRWNCKFSTALVVDMWANTTNQTISVDTTAPKITTSAGTLPNGSVLMAGTLGALTFTATDTGGSTVDETLTNTTLFTDGATKYNITWSSGSEGVYLADFTPDLTATPANNAPNLYVTINLTDNVGNRRQATYLLIWDQEPNNNYASEFNYTANGGTNMSWVNVSDAGVITPITLTLNNTYGSIAMTTATNFNGYDMNLNQHCNITAGSLALSTSSIGASGGASLIFRGLNYGNKPGVYKDNDGCNTACGDVTYSSTTGIASFTTSTFSTYTLYSQDPSGGGSGGAGSYAVCGDGLCSSPIETPDNCALDCGQANVVITPTQDTGNDGFTPVGTPTTPAPTPIIQDKKVVMPFFILVIVVVVILLLIVLLSSGPSASRKRKIHKAYGRRRR